VRATITPLLLVEEEEKAYLVISENIDLRWCFTWNFTPLLGAWREEQERGPTDGERLVPWDPIPRESAVSVMRGSGRL
jgi:hypothetical protein